MQAPADPARQDRPDAIAPVAGRWLRDLRRAGAMTRDDMMKMLARAGIVALCTACSPTAPDTTTIYVQNRSQVEIVSLTIGGGRNLLDRTFRPGQQLQYQVEPGCYVVAAEWVLGGGSTEVCPNNERPSLVRFE